MKILDLLSVADIAVILIYITAMVGVGIRATKKIKKVDDYSGAGQNLSWMMAAGSTIATCMGANMVLGKYDVILESGMSGVTSVLFYWVGWAFLLLMTKKLRDSGVNSIPAFLEKRYDANTRKISSYCVLINMIASCAATFLSVGSILEALGVCNREMGTWIGATVIILFTVFSGLWGVAITDTIQSIFMMVVFGIIFPITVFKTAGGWDTVAQFNGPERLDLFKGIAPITMLGWALANALSTGANPAYAQRIFSARNTKDALLGQGTAWLATLVICGIVTALPGLAIQVIFPDMTVGSNFTPLFVATYFPVVFRALVLAALLALLLTSGDSYLLLIASTILDDIVRPRKPDISNKQALLVIRLVCVASAGVICAMALYIDKIYQLFKIGSGAYGAGVFLPLLFGCFWKKANPKAINLGMLLGCTVSFCFDMLLKAPLNLDMDGCTIGAVLCLLICVAGSLMGTKQITQKQLS